MPVVNGTVCKGWYYVYTATTTSAIPRTITEIEEVTTTVQHGAQITPAIEARHETLYPDWCGIVSTTGPSTELYFSYTTTTSTYVYTSFAEPTVTPHP